MAISKQNQLFLIFFLNFKSQCILYNKFCKHVGKITFKKGFLMLVVYVLYFILNGKVKEINLILTFSLKTLGSCGLLLL